MCLRLIVSSRLDMKRRRRRRREFREILLKPFDNIFFPFAPSILFVSFEMELALPLRLLAAAGRNSYALGARASVSTGTPVPAHNKSFDPEMFVRAHLLRLYWPYLRGRKSFPFE